MNFIISSTSIIMNMPKAIIKSSASYKLIGKISIGCEFKDELPGELSIGYFISKEAMGNGYATEATKAITQHYFPMNENNFFYAVIKPANELSIRVATKAGFSFISQITLPGNKPNEKVLFN